MLGGEAPELFPVLVLEVEDGGLAGLLEALGLGAGRLEPALEVAGCLLAGLEAAGELVALGGEALELVLGAAVGELLAELLCLAACVVELAAQLLGRRLELLTDALQPVALGGQPRDHLGSAVGQLLPQLGVSGAGLLQLVGQLAAQPLGLLARRFGIAQPLFELAAGDRLALLESGAQLLELALVAPAQGFDLGFELLDKAAALLGVLDAEDHRFGPLQRGRRLGGWRGLARLRRRRRPCCGLVVDRRRGGLVAFVRAGIGRRGRLGLALLGHQSVDQLLAGDVQVEELDPHSRRLAGPFGLAPPPDHLRPAVDQVEVLAELELEVEDRARRARGSRVRMNMPLAERLCETSLTKSSKRSKRMAIGRSICARSFWAERRRWKTNCWMRSNSSRVMSTNWRPTRYSASPPTPSWRSQRATRADTSTGSNSSSPSAGTSKRTPSSRVPAGISWVSSRPAPPALRSCMVAEIQSAEPASSSSISSGISSRGCRRRS